MQISPQLPPNNYFPHSWKTNNKTYFSPSPHLPRSLTTKTSFHSDSEEAQNPKSFYFDSNPPNISFLPVVIHKPGNVSQYCWDGSSLRLVRIDEEGINSNSWFLSSDFGFGKLCSVCSLTTRNFFLPQRVNENYLDYVKWKFLHRTFSSALQVLATQAMFRAIGIGFSRSFASAAALNWVLKDGLGRLCRCIYTASLASAFDTNLKRMHLELLCIIRRRIIELVIYVALLKRVRFSTSVLFSLSIGLEMLTPTFPQHFLLIASIANIAKQISLACYLATNSAVHQSFAVADNLGEVSAKAQIQTVCFDNLGLMFAATLNILCKNSQRLQAGLPLVAYPIFATIDLFGIYQGLKHVHLQTLTKDRLEIIISKWIDLGYVPSPAEVSEDEGIDFWGSRGRELLPIRIGCLDDDDQLQKLSMLTMHYLSSEDFYFICLEKNHSRRYHNQGILLCVREGASVTDVITGMLQVCYIRRRLRLSSIKQKSFNNDVSDSASNEWLQMVKDSKHSAEADLIVLKEQMLELGWSIKNILLSKSERVRYSLLR